MGFPFALPVVHIIVACLLARSAHGVKRRALLDDEQQITAGDRSLIMPGASEEVSNEAEVYTLGAGQLPVQQNGILYHSGPVLTGSLNLYLIWYGNWGPNSEEIPIITDFAAGLGETGWWGIHRSYTDGNLNTASTSLTYITRSFDYYSRGASLSEHDLQAIVQHAIESGSLPLDPHGVYFVVGSADVDQDGFCTRYCGWHGQGIVQNVPVMTGYVGDTTRCRRKCQIQDVGPNGASGGDGTASVLAHELTEAVTDPALTGWFDDQGQENADKCAWQFGAVGVAQNGGRYNMWVNGRYYLIQENWVNQGGIGYCAMSLPGVSDG